MGAQLLVRYAKEGDEKAFREFAEKFLGLIYNVALRRTGSWALAEEVSQNVLCAVAKKAGSLARQPERIAPWLHRAATFEASKIMRAEKSQERRKQLRHPDEVLETGDGEGGLGEALPILDEALDQLSAADRAVVMGHYFEGETFQRIGERMNKPAGTVQKQCRRALEKLGRVLRGKGVVLSGTVLASGLGAQLAKGAPSGLVGPLSSQVLAGGTGYAVMPLNWYLATKSKVALGLAAAAVLVPLAVQQAAIQRAGAENERLRALVVDRGGTPMKSSRGERTEVVWVPAEKGVTIETLQRAYKTARRGGRLDWFEFEDLLESLTEEELVELIPQAHNLSGEVETRRELLQRMVALLAWEDPERAVRLTWGLNPKAPIYGSSNVKLALYLWAEKEPEAVVAWLLESEKKVRELARENRPIWSAYEDYVSAALCALIESESPLVRDVLTMAPEMQTMYLLQGALGRPSQAGFYSKNRRETVEGEWRGERVMAFLPWIREFVPEKEGRGGDSQRELLERLMFEMDVRGSEGNERFYEQLVARPELLPDERSWLVGMRAEEVMQGYFNGRENREWEVLEEEAWKWLASYAEEGAEDWFEEIREEVFRKERFQITSRLESLERAEQVRDGDLVRELSDCDYGLFPEYRERALVQAQRIKDDGKRREVIEQIGQ
ncbi:MAG: RNA polymerase sigma factor [Verrucomicrobiota bacterium JB023]|nr:RNA polymerase sigma factor [Verrucomicrobiota bacterium JB023]